MRDQGSIDSAQASRESGLIRLAQRSADRAERQRADGCAASAEECELLLHAALGKREGRPPLQGVETEFAARDEVRAFPRDARLGRFRLLRPLGQGGFGFVLLAFDPRLEREVALKLPRPELLGDPRWRKRFLQEARAVAALDHPGITAIYDVGRIGPACYIASAYCEGPTLAAWLSARGSVAPGTAARLLAQVADAVQHAHSRGVLHRDLKPANILLKLSHEDVGDGLPALQVCDFGLATRQKALNGCTEAMGRVGTLAYMAPEQTLHDGNLVGTATDVYALGAILFELVAGRPPFAAVSDSEWLEMIRSAPAPALRRFRRDAPRDLEAICAKCLAKEPKERYESAAELARELRRFLAGECVLARPVCIPVRVARWRRRRLLPQGFQRAS